jgi:hypothetical protein
LLNSPRFPLLEAFANIYRNFAASIGAGGEGCAPTQIENDYPKIEDGIRGMAFIEGVVAPGKGNAACTSLSV